MMIKQRTHIRELKVVKVIEVRSLCGTGTDSDLARIIVEYYSFDGELLARNDPDADFPSLSVEPITVVGG